MVVHICMQAQVVHIAAMIHGARLRGELYIPGAGIFKMGGVHSLIGKIIQRFKLNGLGAPDIETALRVIILRAFGYHQVVINLVPYRGKVGIDLYAVHIGVIYRVIVDITGCRLEQQFICYIDPFIFYVGNNVVIYIVDAAAKDLDAAIEAFVYAVIIDAQGTAPAARIPYPCATFLEVA